MHRATNAPSRWYSIAGGHLRRLSRCCMEDPAMISSCSVSPTSRIAVVVLAFLFCWAASDTAAQQSKPNLTGTWKLNRGKSKLASQHGPGDDEYIIKHSEPRISIVHMFNGISETYFYVTDGKERVANVSDHEGQLRAKTYWDRDTLVIEKRQDNDLRVSAWVSRYELSQDGSTLVVTQHVAKSSFSDAFDELLTYEKQRR